MLATVGNRAPDATLDAALEAAYSLVEEWEKAWLKESTELAAKARGPGREIC